MKIQNPHDKFFKETFGDIEVAKDFLNNYLPQSVVSIIDVDTLELQKDSFINGGLQEVFSDMLFRVDISNKEGYIYFLFEHKSYKSKNITFQLLKYMVEIWEAKTKKENINELPMIIPLVIYHGKESWNVTTTLGEMIKGYKDFPEEIQQFIPDYKYLLYDISRYTNEEIKGEVQLRILLTIFRDIFTKDNKELQKSIYRAVEYLQELEDKQTSIEYFETLMKYILNAGRNLTQKDANEIVQMIKLSYPEGSETVMTLAERFREEGMEKGIEKGMEKGEANALIKTAIKLLTKKFGAIPEELKASIAKLDIITLDIIIGDILEYESLEDLRKYIN